MTAASQKELRQRALRARRSLDDATRQRASARIADTFLHSPNFYSASRIGCYLSTPEEVDTIDILARTWNTGKQIYCPVVARRRPLKFVEVTRETALAISAFGLLEPVYGDEIDPLSLDVVVVPVVAFDADGHRIGMGGGYYDRTFAALRNRNSWQHPKLVGVAFDCQKVRKIKANPWDIRMHRVLTERD